MGFYTYDGGVAADQATGRPLVGQVVQVIDQRTDAPVQAYRDGTPVTLVTGAHGLIAPFQTEDTTAHVWLKAGPIRLRQTASEVLYADSEGVAQAIEKSETALTKVQEVSGLANQAQQDAETALQAVQGAGSAAATAETNAKAYADTVATNARTTAISTAAADATTKANNAKSDAITDAAAKYVPPAAPVLSLAPHQIVSAPQYAGDFFAPSIVKETELTRDPDGRTVDGTKWFAPINVGKLPGTWIDQWYAYCAGHDSPAVHLLTAPDLLGPWTWRQAVVGIPGSGALMEDSDFQHHTSSPDAMVVDGKIYLYYHGPTAANSLHQPTALAISTNGVNFTDQGVVLNTEYDNAGSPYRTSVSYVTFAKHQSIYHAIWQGTTGYDSTVAGYTYIPMPVGHAVSVDGKAWTKLPPILPSGNRDQGLLAPGLFRVAGGWMVVGTYRSWDGATSQNLNVACFFGEDLNNLRRYNDIVLPGSPRQQNINTPKFIAHKNRLYMIAGVRPQGTSQPAIITAAELEWR